MFGVPYSALYYRWIILDYLENTSQGQTEANIKYSTSLRKLNKDKHSSLFFAAISEVKCF